MPLGKGGGRHENFFSSILMPNLISCVAFFEFKKKSVVLKLFENYQNWFEKLSKHLHVNKINMAASNAISNLFISLHVEVSKIATSRLISNITNEKKSNSFERNILSRLKENVYFVISIRLGGYSLTFIHLDVAFSEISSWSEFKG